MNELEYLKRITVLLIFITLFISTFFNNNIVTFFYGFLLFLNGALIVRYLNNPALLLFFIFSSFYALSFIPYYFFNIKISPWPDFNEPIYYKIVTQIYGVFLCTCYFIKTNRTSFVKNLSFQRRPNILAFFLFFSISVLVLLFGQTGENIFTSGGYAIGETSKSSIFEYFILFFLLAYYFSCNNRISKLMLFALALCYIGKSLMFGGRIEVIQLLLLVFFILTINHSLKFSPIVILLGCLSFYYLNQVFSSIRSNPVGLLSGDYTSYLNPFTHYADTSVEYISSNEGDVIQSSARLIGLIENGFLDFIGRIKGGIGFILSIFVPSSILPAEASLITFKKNMYDSGGGGLAPVYYFAYLSWFGPILFSKIIFWINELTNNNKSIYLKLYVLLVFSTFPRWFAYNPIIMFKLCAWVIPILFLSRLFLSTTLFNYGNAKR